MIRAKSLIGFVVIVILSVSVIFNPFSKTYISELRSNSVYVSTQDVSNLQDLIEAAAKKFNKAPSDAKIDRVWKAMPGYNGLEVDVEASYNKMIKEKAFDVQKIVFKQIPPKIHLEDLPPSPIYRGHPEKPAVSFLINVAWGNEYLPSILATLKENKVHATFFLEGRWVKENPDLAKMIADGGHEIGNHSYSHPNMANISSYRMKEELVKTNEIIEATTGKTVTWFGPPAGAFREETVLIADSLHMKTVMWTVDTIDWREPTPEQLIQRVISKVHPGAMILMHPTKATEKALNTLISEIRSKNLRIGTVTKLMDEERIIKREELDMEENTQHP
ncbi:MAG TPA: polysaccharide deacetylase family protein [Bacillaceae bacterium]|nr:polysaccharide deacetylase family protein [Paenibacillus bovis]HLU21855.1 polysaccharide deacetylase family protein [Bacillaceae bacterium]